MKIKNKIYLYILKKLNGFICYNYLIKSLILLYMFFYLSSLLTTIDVYVDNADRVAEYTIGISAFLFHIFFIFAIFTIIQKYFKKIEESESFRKKISSIISDIYFEKKTCARFYIPIYLLRKAVFMTIIVTFDNFYLLLAHCFVMLAITSILRPYRMFSMNFMAIFNEVMITIIMGFSGFFTIKSMNNQKALNLGWVWIALATATIFFNWVIWIGIQVYNIKNRKKRIGRVEGKEKEEVKIDKENKEGKDEDGHDFEERREGETRNVEFVEEVYADESRERYKSPGKKESEVNILRMENWYEDEKGKDEEEDEYDYAKFRRKHRKMTGDEEYRMPFSYSPTVKTTASPNKVNSADVSDEIQSIESNEFSINVKLVGEVGYGEESKQPSRFNQIDNKNEYMESSASTKQVPLYNSSKNILRIRDLD